MEITVQVAYYAAIAVDAGFASDRYSSAIDVQARCGGMSHFFVQPVGTVVWSGVRRVG